jgi:CHASE2 domain-containing sensor protein
MLLGAGMGFLLGWISKPKYAPEMSHGRQVGIVCGVAVVAAVVIGSALGVGGWELLAVCVLLPLLFASPYVGGEVRERGRARLR